MLFRKKSSIIALNDLVKRLIKHETQRQQFPICEYLWLMDQIYLHTFAQMLDDEDFRKDFSSSKGLCIPHFVSAIQMTRVMKLKNPIYIIQTLLYIEVKQFQLIENLLSEFIRKQSWNFRSEPAGPEIKANFLALNSLVGAKGFYMRKINL